MDKFIEHTHHSEPANHRRGRNRRALSTARKTRKNLENNKTGTGRLGSDIGTADVLQGGHDGHGPVRTVTVSGTA